MPVNYTSIYDFGLNICMKTLREMMDLIESAQQGVAVGSDNPYKDINPNAWHLIQGDRPIAINFPDEYRAKSFHSGHGYGRETKVLHGSQVRQNAYLKHNPGVINYPEYSKGVAEEQVEESTPDALAKIDELTRR